MIRPTILIIEDDKSIRNFIKVSLEAQEYKCIETYDITNGLALAYSHNPQVIILDLGLPDGDGLKIIDEIKKNLAASILIVSARGRDQDKVDALDLGADDYLTKPFSLPELLARIRVCLRHQATQATLAGSMVMNNYEVGELFVDFDKHRGFLSGKEIHLTPNEFKLLELLAKNAGKVMTHRLLMKSIWGSVTESDTQSVRVFMANIRRKIEIDSAQPRYLLTEVGVGYRLVDE